MSFPPPIFGQVINEITTLDAHVDNQRGNFSGEYSFSNPQFAQISADYLQKFYKPDIKHCDLGASRGTLSSILRQRGWNSFAIDGTSYGLKNGLLDIAPEFYAVLDLTSFIEGLGLEKAFDLTTAFEITEHIPKNMLWHFIPNVQMICKKLVCSVHFGGEEQGSHYNIKPTSWWIEQFSKYGKVSKLDDFRALLPFEESDFLLVEFDEHS